MTDRPHVTRRPRDPSRALPVLALLGLVVAGALPACDPGPDGVRIGVLALDPATGGYTLQARTFTTLEDVPAFRGAAATAIGDAEIFVDPSKLADGLTEAAFREQVLLEEGAPPEAQFVEEDGVLWPADFHSLCLATTYHAFERARLYAIARGMDEDGPTRAIEFHYFPSFSIGEEGAQPFADNAAFFPLLHAFVLLPFSSLQEIPLAANEGVIAHEYAHAIFNAEVHGGSWLPPYLLTWPVGSPSSAMLGAVEEGLADMWAGAVSGDPRFARHSLRAYVGDSRDLDRFEVETSCYSDARFRADLREGAGSADPELFWLQRQYQLGTVLARALWAAGLGGAVSHDDVMDAVFAGYASVGDRSLRARIEASTTGSELFTFAIPIEAFLAGANDDATRAALCAVLLDRFSLSDESVGGRCAGVTLRSECP